MKKIFLFSILAFFGFFSQIVFSAPTIYPTGVTIYKPDKTFPGYNLYSPMHQKPKLIDMQGNIVNEWIMAPEEKVVLVKPMRLGTVLFDVNKHRLVQANWKGKIIWYYYNPEYEFHHDFQRLENGNILILARKRFVVPHINPLPLAYDSILEITRQGDIVWTWHSAEHFDEFGFSKKSKEYIYDYRWDDIPSISPGYMDLYHTNSIQSLPPNKNEHDPRFKKGNILISQRHTNIVFIIDKESGNIVWQIGPDDNMTIGQHDAQMIEEGLPGAGNILIFDNRSDGGYPRKIDIFSRIIEIDPITKEIVWQWNAFDALDSPHWTFYSSRISGAQRLPNGNTLINEGMFGRFFEVTEKGEIVWEYVEKNPAKMIYRVYRVPLDWVP